MTEITAVSIAPEEAWDCDHCGQKQTIAYLTDEDGDETFGYCEDCIGPALVASLKPEPKTHIPYVPEPKTYIPPPS